ncbi:transglycosylase family protein [Mycolicibacterium llatzerense]|uniref:transglycosylase family protein n=1 Tax=Mycolicibacterium llatzerense TaxID=280871 RepID=UPI0027DF9470|nr:transglycosylase family protein [Mycolicibacterium llatzerense]MCT7361233.1 hypothetical protein [Mycolicibacterium llatzerense]
MNQGLGKVDTDKSRAQAALLERAYDKAADAAGNLRREEARLEEVNAKANATNAQKIAAAERFEKARRAEARATREAVNALREHENESRAAAFSLDSLSTATSAAERNMANLSTAATGAGSSIASSFNPAGIAAVGAAIVGAATVGTVAIGALGGAIAELSGVLGTLPGLGVAGAAAVGTLTLATQGFSDALGDIRDSKKFNEDLKQLSPNAAQAASAIQQLLPSFDGLRFATSDSLFAGVGQQLTQLSNTYLPAVQQMTTSIAGSFNQMFSGVANQLMTPETQGAIQSTMTNIGQAFQNLVPAIGPVTKAIGDLVNVSSGFLPGFATAIANAATAFSNFVSDTSKTGELKQWITDGVDALKQLGTLLPDLKNMFSDFKANGKDGMDVVVGATRVLIKVLGGIADIFGDLSRGWKMQANVAAMSFGMIEKAISAALTPMREIIKLNNRLNPLFKIPEIPDFGPKQITVPFPDTQFGMPGTTSGRAVRDMDAGTVPSGPGGLGNTVGMTPGPGAVNQMFLPDQAKAGGSKKQPLPTVAAAGQDPMSLLQGFPATASLYGAAGSVLDNQQKVAQAKSDLNTLEKANVRDEDAITAKRNELARAEREEHESELRLTEAKQQAVQKSLKGMQTASGELQQLGVELDKDFGISKGLGGIIENAVKALGNALAAPFLQALGFVAKANPNEGSGLVGIAAANGAFGSQYTPGAIAMMQASQRGGGNSFVGLPGTRGGQPYGLPAGTDTGGYGSSGPAFPQWVHNLEQAFGVKASTYAGHQESDRNEPGYAPNPMHQNRGIDWSGSPEAMQRFATYMASQPNAEQVIYQNPLTGQAKEAVAGQARPGYFADQLSGHQKHVHTRQAYSIGEQGLPQGADQATGSLNSLASAANSAASALGGGLSTQQWNNIAGAEASGNWQANTGNGFYGGLQIMPSTWNAFGGPQYAPRADLASPEQQMAVGNNILAGQGPGAWPATSAAHPEWFQPGVGIPASMGPGGGGMMPGMGPPQGLPGVGLGNVYPSQGGNSGNILGGMAMDGIMAATSGLDMLAPGTSAAAKIGIQVANRTIGYAAQNAGILANGVGEFFSVGDNPKGSIGAGWLGKLAGGIAGAAPALPNLAAKKAPEQPAGGQQQGGGNTYGDTNINVTAREGASGQEHGEQIAAEQGRIWSPAGSQ